MKKIKFHFCKTEIDFLLGSLQDKSTLEILESAKKNGPIRAKGIYDTGRYEVFFSREELSIVLDDLSDVLMQKGLDVNTGEPNSLGYRIEALIDIFNVNCN